MKERVRWLGSELIRNGTFITEYDEATNYPKRFVVSPPSSYGAKLIMAYRILGGVPERDMLLRTSDQPVFLTRGVNISQDPNNTNSGYSDLYSNGRRNRGGQRFDRDLAIQVEKFKKWQLESIKRKREHLEFKIKRALDYSDQLAIEMKLLQTMLDSNSGQTVDDFITKINQLMFRNGAANVVDNINDPLSNLRDLRNDRDNQDLMLNLCNYDDKNSTYCTIDQIELEF